MTLFYNIKFIKDVYFVKDQYVFSKNVSIPIKPDYNLFKHFSIEPRDYTCRFPEYIRKITYLENSDIYEILIGMGLPRFNMDPFENVVSKFKEYGWTIKIERSV